MGWWSGFTQCQTWWVKIFMIIIIIIIIYFL
jgi:hypothetical protein